MRRHYRSSFGCGSGRCRGRHRHRSRKFRRDGGGNSFDRGADWRGYGCRCLDRSFRRGKAWSARCRRDGRLFGGARSRTGFFRRGRCWFGSLLRDGRFSSRCRRRGFFAAGNQSEECERADGHHRQAGSGRDRTSHDSASSWMMGGPSWIAQTTCQRNCAVPSSYGHV